MLPCYTCGCAHTACWAWSFFRLLACLSPSIRLLVYLFQWVLFSSRVPILRDGVTPAGLRIFCPRSERRFSPHLDQVHWSVSWMDLAPLSAASLCALSLRVCCQVVLAVSMCFGCTLLSPVFFTVPCWGYLLPPRPLLQVWGCHWYPTLDPAGWG